MVPQYAKGQMLCLHAFAEEEFRFPHQLLGEKKREQEFVHQKVFFLSSEIDFFVFPLSVYGKFFALHKGSYSSKFQ